MFSRLCLIYLNLIYFACYYVHLYNSLIIYFIKGGWLAWLGGRAKRAEPGSVIRRRRGAAAPAVAAVTACRGRALSGRKRAVPELCVPLLLRIADPARRRLLAPAAGLAPSHGLPPAFGRRRVQRSACVSPPAGGG